MKNPLKATPAASLVHCMDPAMRRDEENAAILQTRVEEHRNQQERERLLAVARRRGSR